MLVFSVRVNGISGAQRAARAAAKIWLAALLIVNVYRAATQSVTADEAFTYNHFAGGDEPVKVYDSNNHVLFTWLARGSVAVFGLSELSLRLPSLLGGCLYLAAVFRLSAHLFAPAWLFGLAVVSLSLNPFVLDFLSAARGYGLALGLWLWAIYELAVSLGEAVASTRRVRLAAILLALAVAANLNLAPPGAALAVSFALLALWRWPPARLRLAWLARNLVGPGLLVSILILFWPLRTASRSSFYFGVESLRQTLQGLVFYSFCHARPNDPSFLQDLLWHVTPKFVVYLLVLLAGACLYLLVKGRGRKLEGLAPPEQSLLLLGGAAFATLALLAAAWRLAGLKYPVDRTALYWIPLFTLLCLACLASSPPRLVAWLLAAPVCAFLLLAVLQYALQFNTRFYAQWRYDAATKRLAQLIRDRETAMAGRRVRIGATWLFEPSLNFYRQCYRMHWLEKVTRDGPHGDFDYYVLHGPDTALVEQLRLHVIYRDEFSGTVLAIPGGVLKSRP